ncbi:MAG: tetratricopeptide repeat protein [Candidatus Aminicenantes bacterium]|nr:tetratricopeptide repeat protein [Candidatus Aminicenantes bacterium]
MDLTESGADIKFKTRLRTFIASSAELHHERERAASVLNYLQKIIDVHIEPVRYETDMESGSVDTPTIQEKIDELLKECNPVIVLFYSKVGTFTLAELHLALKLGKKVFVYFKTGYSPGKIDEVEKFKEILELKNSIESDNRVLINEFDTIDRLENILSRDILLYLKNNFPTHHQGQSEFETFLAETRQIVSNRHSSTSHPLQGKKLTDLDSDRLLNFMNQERVIVEFIGKNMDTLEKKLDHFHLMMADKYLLKGTYLCFGKNIPEVCQTATPAKFFVFETEDISKPIINIAVNGNLLEQYFAIVDHLKKNLYLIRDVYTREAEDYEIPLAVIRELLANAFVHRDYGDDILSNIQVELYPDRLEIVNPGNFPDEISLDHLEEINISLPINKEISTVFFLYGIVERAGKGIRRIQQELKKKALTPAIFYQNRKSRYVKVIVKRKERRGVKKGDKAGDTYLLTNFPPRKVKFIGRKNELKAIEEHLENINNKIMVNGLGGIGKTELCKQFFLDQYYNYNYAGWIDGIASIKESILTSVTIEIPGIRETDTPDERFHKIVSYLKRLEGKILLVFDNINNPNDNDLDTIVSLPGNFKVMANSRAQVDGFPTFTLEGLNTGACVDLFYEYYNVREGETEVKKIIALAGNHPLTIELLAKTAWNRAIGVRQLYELLEQKGFNINEIFNEPISTFWHERDRKPLFDHLLTIFDLSGISENEFHILANLSVLPAVYIHINDFCEWLNLETRENINQLITKGWMTRHGFRILVHPVIQEVVRYKVSPGIDRCEDLITAIGNKLTLEPGDNPFDKREFALMAESILAHIRENDELIANLANNLSAVYHGMGNIEKALEYQIMTLAIKEIIFDANHPSLVLSYNNLSSIYNNLGQLEKALEFQEKVLKIREAVLAQNHPDLAASYNNLAMIYQALGQLERALEYQDKAQKIWEAVFSPIHPHLATSYNNLSTIYKALGQLDRALEYQEKALKIQESVLNPVHPDLAASYHNLSAIYQALGQLDRALDYARRSVVIMEKLFPTGHPNLDKARKNLAKIAGED